jgi:hypothetical protein
MTDATRAQELDALLSHILDRPERPTWITGRNVHAEACLRLEWEDVELLRELCRQEAGRAGRVRPEPFFAAARRMFRRWRSPS